MDICLDDEKKNQLKVKRQQKFITDKYGFRNSKIDLSESDLHCACQLRQRGVVLKIRENGKIKYKAYPQK